MSAELERLLELARHHAWTETERREHAISFAYGNCAIENPAITRELVEREYAKLFPAAGSAMGST